MKDKIVIAPKGAKYLTEIDEIKRLKKIPENYVFNKGITGCGATQLAI